MSARAGVSESAFFEIFPNVGECYRAACEQGLERLAGAVGDAAGREHSWLGRVRSGLVALLGFFDDEPTWARLLLFGAPLDNQLYDVLARLLLDWDGDGELACAAPMHAPALTGKLVLGGIISVIRASMLEDGDAGQLVELAPSLVLFVAVQYGVPVPGAEPPAHAAGAHARAVTVADARRLPMRATHRTTLVLHEIAGAPYSNNREIARAAGIADEGQASKLLARLERKGVIQNVGIGAARGEPNAWLLTASGRRALELLSESRATGPHRDRGVGVYYREEKEQ